MRLLFRFILMGMCFLPWVTAQDVIELDEGAVGAHFTLKQLRTTGSILHVVAHPDDEDGALLAYCARGLGARTMLFSMTRGEGGANLISDDFFDQLGALRTLEHQKAAGYYGNELFYSRAADYGYSKTLEEAMQQWDRGLPILADLVEVIRREKPTILVSRFRGDSRDGHGHHQMAGVLSRAAFDAAADASQFPEQLRKGLKPWQVKKLYVGQRFGSSDTDDRAAIVAVPTGTYDPMIGRSYAQLARFGLGFQRSQGISGHDGQPGPRDSLYRLERFAGEAVELVTPEESIFQGIDTRLTALLNDTSDDELAEAKQILAEIERGIQAIWDSWDPRTPSSSVASLTKLLNQLRSLKLVERQVPGQSDDTSHWKQQIKRTEGLLQDAIVQSAGLRLDSWASQVGGGELNFATPGSSVEVYVRLANQNESFEAKLSKLQAQSSDDASLSSSEIVGPGAVYTTSFPVQLAESQTTRPHWHRDSIREPLYQVTDEGQQAASPRPPLWVAATIEVGGAQVVMATAVQTRVRHPEFGQVSYPLAVVPAISINFALSNSVLPASKSPSTLPVVVRSEANEPTTAMVQLELPDGWTSKPVESNVSFQRAGEERTLEFEVQPAMDASGEYSLAAVASAAGREYREGFETVSARDIGRMNIYHPALHHLRIADIQLSGNPLVGYIAGSGDQVAESLQAFDIRPQMLTESDLANADLGKFDVILVGVRAYAVRGDLRKYNARLLEYVKSGGVMIVQYQTPEFDANFGPYPYQMGRRPEEVSEEDAAVTMLQPHHVLFRAPNPITEADFEGWFEQRGSKFWTSWDDRYVPLLSSHDAGQAPQQGGMMFASYGQGIYVYSAYAWYRQLPNGVPGAYRLFANMLSLPETGSPE